MKKLLAMTFAGLVALAAGGCAQDRMVKDDAMKKEEMMKKDGMMKKQ